MTDDRYPPADVPARRRHWVFVLRLLAIIAVAFLNVAVVYACLRVFERQCLDLLPFAPGDGAIGDALIYLIGGYIVSFAGLVAYYVCRVLTIFWPRTIRILVVALPVAALLGILAVMVLVGRRQGGYLLYWFMIAQLSFWIMCLADALVCRGRR
jgi:hypothetical protein